MDGFSEEIKAGFINKFSKEDELICIKNAYQESRRLLLAELLEKRKELARKLKKAKNHARRLAYHQGMSAARKNAAETLMEAKEVYEVSIGRANRDCLELAVSIAREILKSEIESNTESLAARIKNALSDLMSTGQVKIFTNPSQVSMTREKLNQGLDASYAVNACENIAPGDARIETNRGVVELNWISELNIIEKRLLESLENKLSRSMRKGAAY